MILKAWQGPRGGLRVTIKCDREECNVVKDVLNPSNARQCVASPHQYCSRQCSNSVKIASTRHKISLSKRGPKNPNFGKVRSAEENQRNREANSGSKNGMYGRTWRDPPEVRLKKSLAQRGERHPMHGAVNVTWEPWMTERSNLWSRHIKRLFGYRCASCGRSHVECLNDPKELTAHHIVPRSSRPDLRYDLNNGIALCHACHMQAHRLLRKDPHVYKNAMLNLICLKRMKLVIDVQAMVACRELTRLTEDMGLYEWQRKPS